MKMKTLKAGTLALGLTLCMGMTAFAGQWNQDTTGWRYSENGADAAATWVKDGGRWYHLGNDGYMNTGWFQDSNGAWYYLNTVSNGTKGAMFTGWVNVDGTWFFLDSTGAMQSGWVQVNGKAYYLNPVSDGTKGSMKTGSVVIDGKTYNFAASGELNGTAPSIASNKKFDSNGYRVYDTSDDSDDETETVRDVKKEVSNAVNNINNKPEIKEVLEVQFGTEDTEVVVAVADETASAKALSETMVSTVTPMLKGAAEVQYQGGEPMTEAEAKDKLNARLAMMTKDETIGDYIGRTYTVDVVYADGSTASYTVTVTADGVE